MHLSKRCDDWKSQEAGSNMHVSWHKGKVWTAENSTGGLPAPEPAPESDSSLQQESVKRVK